ncbi:MAG: DHHA1 domain-containing protein [archaeon]
MEKGSRKLEEFDSFVEKISAKDRIALFFDNDPDGISSAVITAIALKRIRGRAPETIRHVHHSEFGKFGKIASAKKFDVIIILDLPLDSFPKVAKTLEKRGRVLNIDHHGLYREISSKNTLLLKPQFYSEIEPSRYPTAKMCFDLFSRRTGLPDLDWITAIGIIGDHAWGQWGAFLKKTEKNWGISEKELYAVENILAAFLALREGKETEVVRFLLKSDGPKEFLESDFAECVKEFDAEVEKERGIALKKVERDKKHKLLFYRFRPKFRVKNAVISALSYKYPDWNVIVAEEDNTEVLRVSARRQDFGLSMGKLLEESVKGIRGARGGGHVPAAGATMRKKDLRKFRKNLVRVLEEGGAE